MIEIVFDYLSENIGVTLTLIIFIGIALLVAAYYIGKKMHEIQSLPCEEHHHSIEEHRNDIKNFIGSISKLEGMMESVIQSVNAMQQTVSVLQAPNNPNRPFIPKKANAYSKKQSPRQLNGNGIALFNDVKGQEFIESNRGFLFGKIDALLPKTAYDVEVAALTVLRINQNNDIFDGLKNWVYLAPSRTILDDEGKSRQTDVALDDVLFVISLPLRDAYLLEHPELVPVEELEEA